jgi:hypothetical protein
MARDPYVHAKEDLGNIGEWLAGRSGARTGGGMAPRANPVPQPADDAVEALETVLPVAPVTEPVEAPKPKKAPEAKKAESCSHCDKPLPSLRSAGARFCSRACSRAARKRMNRLQPYFPN